MLASSDLRGPEPTGVLPYPAHVAINVRTITSDDWSMGAAEFDARIDALTDGHITPVVLVAHVTPAFPGTVDAAGFSRYPTIGRVRPRGRLARCGIVFWARQSGMPAEMPAAFTYHSTYGDAIAAALQPV